MTIAAETYAIIGGAVRNHLKTLAAGTQISTAQLVEALYTRDEERELAFRAIKAMTFGTLADCWDYGPEVERYGRKVRPKLWHRPTVKTCKHCGGEL